MSETRAFLRHALATLAYRAAKPIRGASARFGEFRVSPTSRTPREILAHMGDLMDWALGMVADGESRWHEAEPLEWSAETTRFHTRLEALDRHLASEAEVRWPLEVIFQGPVADALQHVGQLTLLRRAAGEPMRGESYARAEIVVGRVGIEQAPPRAEFDE